MHPAFSVIVFTTATGAGYGLLAMLGALAVIGRLPADARFGLATLAIALVLITGGLLSSTLHLGRPERAWRAFSQWRSSWLSREGIASVVTYVPAGVFGIAWVVLQRTDGIVVWAGAASVVCAVATLVTTGMIYASLKPIPQWHSVYTVPGYIIYALMSGVVLLHAILRVWGQPVTAVAWAALALTAIGWGWKIATWRHNDALAEPVSTNSATGLAGGNIHSVEWPHTEANFVMKEMGYRIARKHAVKLRLFVHALAFAIPLAFTALALGAVAAPVAATLAVVAQAIGLLVERLLFFAEARHVVGLYYGR
jgi:DMSO reductase anchor subunit